MPKDDDVVAERTDRPTVGRPGVVGEVSTDYLRQPAPAFRGSAGICPDIADLLLGYTLERILIDRWNILEHLCEGDLEKLLAPTSRGGNFVKVAKSNRERA